MKRSVFFLLIAMAGSTVLGQSAAIEAMFDKYGEREGFTVVTISGKMLSMFSGQETRSDQAGNIIGRLKSVRILTVEDSLLNRNINFYTELSKQLNLSVYEELMLVKEGPDITRFLIRQKGDIITELLVITGGPGGNSLISITGDLDIRSIANLSREMGMEDLEKLENIEKKDKKN
ncbi:MAG: DUF4252 domain-containing protein [Bacteroidales bacterium]|jgi:hypothetical protein|nr:DUF4252 domain-containing protein [Bacteroidales bacterium]